MPHCHVIVSLFFNKLRRLSDQETDRPETTPDDCGTCYGQLRVVQAGQQLTVAPAGSKASRSVQHHADVRCDTTVCQQRSFRM